MQLSAGLLEVFELRFANPPYWLIWLCFEDATMDHKVGMLIMFLNQHARTVFLFCRRLRMKYSTISAMLISGARVVFSWA